MDSNGGKKPWFCKAFQTGVWNLSRDHESNDKWQRHICATCLDKGKTLNHAVKDCNCTKKPKNEQWAVTHDPSLKSNESYPSDFETGENVYKKFRSRYVYSSHCNSTAVESLLAMSKHKALNFFVIR